MNHIFFLVSVLCVLCQVYHVEAFISRGMIQNKVFQSKTSTLVSAKADETDDEMRERLRVKVRKNLYSDKGVAYAPWVTNQIDEDVSFATIISTYLLHRTSIPIVIIVIFYQIVTIVIFYIL